MPLPTDLCPWTTDVVASVEVLKSKVADHVDQMERHEAEIQRLRARTHELANDVTPVVLLSGSLKAQVVTLETDVKRLTQSFDRMSGRLGGLAAAGAILIP